MRAHLLTLPDGLARARRVHSLFPRVFTNPFLTLTRRVLQLKQPLRDFVCVLLVRGCAVVVGVAGASWISKEKRSSRAISGSESVSRRSMQRDQHWELPMRRYLLHLRRFLSLLCIRFPSSVSCPVSRSYHSSHGHLRIDSNSKTFTLLPGPHTSSARIGCSRHFIHFLHILQRLPEPWAPVSSLCSGIYPGDGSLLHPS